MTLEGSWKSAKRDYAPGDNNDYRRGRREKKGGKEEKYRGEEGVGNCASLSYFPFGLGLLV